MKKVTVVTMAVLFVVSFLIGATTTNAQEVSKVQIIPLDTFVGTKTPVSANAGFDIGWVDSGVYYLAERTVLGTPNSGRVEIINAIEGESEGFIPGFVGTVSVPLDPADPRGSRKSGPNGIVVIPARFPNLGKKELWAGDGDSTVKVVDLSKKAIVATIPTGGSNRSDELAYDPIDHIIMIANDLEPIGNPGKFPFVTFIDQAYRTVVGHIVYDGSCTQTPCPPGHGPNANPGGSPGLEQPVFDAPWFYLSVPATVDMPGGEIDVIDPVNMNIVGRFDAFGCNPTGLSLGPMHHLVVGCGPPATIIINDRTGGLVASVTGFFGADEVWFNPGDMKYYLASSSQGLGVIDAITNTLVTTVPTGPGAHSVAVNSMNNHVFVPNAADKGIAVFEPADENNELDLGRICGALGYTVGGP